MAFGKSTQKSEQTGNAAEAVYLKLSAGERIVRILDQEETDFWRYWLSGEQFKNLGKGKSIVVGRDGPIKAYMDALGEGSPGYRKVNRRMLLNVLDRTPVKRTSKGVAVYADEKGQFPSSLDGEDLRTAVVAPNNRVLVIEFGSDLLDAFLLLHEKVKSRDTGEALPIWKFDVKIITRGSGFDTKRMVIPDIDQGPLPDELLALSKYDLSTFVRPMPHEAQERILNGDDYATVIKDLGWERPVPTLPQF